MNEYVDTYLTYVRDENKFDITTYSKSVTFISKDELYIDLSKQDDILTFIDVLSYKYKISLAFTCPDSDGGCYERYADYDLLCKNNRIYFSTLSIQIK